MRHIKHRRKSGPARKSGAIRKVAELAIAAPQVVAIRTARMLAAGARPDPAERAEMSQMVREKGEAFSESMFSIGAQIVKTNQEYSRTAALQWWKLWMSPWQLAAYRPAVQTLASLPQAAARIAVPSPARRQRAVSKLVEAAVTPVHKRATGNARRLTRIKKKR